MQRKALKAKEEEQQKWDELSNLNNKQQLLKGENDYIKGQHTEAKNKFIAANKEASVSDVFRDLYNKDQKKSAEAMMDTFIKPESMPIWKDINFLERADNKQINLDDPKELKNEIVRIKHENKDFAAELDRAQTLLKLQSNIEQEQRNYLEEEKKRLKILAQSTSMKA